MQTVVDRPAPKEARTTTSAVELVQELAQRADRLNSAVPTMSLMKLFDLVKSAVRQQPPQFIRL